MMNWFDKLKKWIHEKRELDKKFKIADPFTVIMKSLTEWKIKTTKSTNRKLEEIENLARKNRHDADREFSSIESTIDELTRKLHKIEDTCKKIKDIEKQFDGYFRREDKVLSSIEQSEERCVNLYKKMQQTQETYLSAIDTQVRDAVRIIKEKAKNV